MKKQIINRDLCEILSMKKKELKLVWFLPAPFFLLWLWQAGRREMQLIASLLISFPIRRLADGILNFLNCAIGFAKVSNIILLIFISSLTAQNNAVMNVEVVINADYGWPTKIIINGTTPDDNTFLGISLYPYNITDAQTGGRHSNMELKKGSFHHEINVDQPLLGGSFEFAVWGKKVDKVDCTLDYCYWCKSNGFHFDDLLVYKSGLLNQMKGYE